MKGKGKLSHRCLFIVAPETGGSRFNYVLCFEESPEEYPIKANQLIPKVGNEVSQCDTISIVILAFQQKHTAYVA